MKTQRFTVEIITDENGDSKMSSENEGFNPMELLGVLNFKIHDIMFQLEQRVKPAKIVRKVIKS